MPPSWQLGTLSCVWSPVPPQAIRWRHVRMDEQRRLAHIVNSGRVATMRALSAQHPRNLPVWLSVAVWLAAFLSPSAYLLLLVFWNRSQVPAPPAGFIVALFCLIP